METTWVIKGVPRYADDGMIIKTLAQSCNQWPGWVVRPKRLLTSTRGKYTTWLVEAAGQPPMSTITLNKQLITIEKFVERPQQGARVNAWFKLKATPRHEISPGQIYQEEYLEAEDEAKADTSAKKEAVDQSGQDGKDVLMTQMAPSRSHEDNKQPGKRRINEIGKAVETDLPKDQHEDSSLVPFLKKMLEEKEEAMRGMQRTIDMLNERLTKMQATLDRMERQQTSAEQENL